MSDAPRSVSRFLAALRWIDGTPLSAHLEPYRVRLFERAFNTFDAAGYLRYNLVLSGRAKKNWKTADLVFACYLALLIDSPGGNQVYIVANDEDQAGDDLSLAKKLRAANPLLKDHTRSPKRNVIERTDGAGFIEILPAQDALGAHGKTYRLLAVDEIHGYRSYDLLEALAPDPTRDDVQQWITSYASIFHRPGVPLFDMVQAGKAGTDPRMLFSWYAADFTTDPDFANVSPENRANPSRSSWKNPRYLEQQARRLPAHKYRRLHLNLPGLPEGAAYQPEPVMDAIDRGVRMRAKVDGLVYSAFVDMSGGSADDAVLAIAHLEASGRAVLDVVMHQGAPAPFDPRKAVERFTGMLQAYGLAAVTGDKYAGETFVADFRSHGIAYHTCDRSKSELYEALEPELNARAVVLLDVPVLEQQLLGLVWRGGRIDHAGGEHDDWANAAAGAVLLALTRAIGMSAAEVERALEIGAGTGEGAGYLEVQL